MTQFERTKATILFVEVPEDVENIESHGNYITYHTGMGTENYDILRTTLPEGTWQFITLLKDAREDQAVNVVDSIFDKYYMDYENPNNNTYAPGYTFDTALESLHSLANSLGVKGNAAVLVKVSV